MTSLKSINSLNAITPIAEPVDAVRTESMARAVVGDHVGDRVRDDAGAGDRVGLTWHPLLAAAILGARDRIDVLEVIPEGRFLDSRRARLALRALGREFPVAIHGVSLGLASTMAVDDRRLDAFARLIDAVQPEGWSEHLAFVRAGGVELGHLAAPARTAATIDATARNIARARTIVGATPQMENVATLIDPPGSTMPEETWLRRLLATTDADLLLDLHNLHANGVNFGFDPHAALEALPADRIRTIHIAGGMEIAASTGDRRLLDDHLHDVPDPVYALLEHVGARVPHAVTVVLERDGAFPAFDVLLAQLDRARAALAAGRARRQSASAGEETPSRVAMHDERRTDDVQPRALRDATVGPRATP